MKGLLLVPMAFAIALTTGCAATDKISDELHIFGGHHNELKHRIDVLEDQAVTNQEEHAAVVAAAAKAQAAADKAQAEAEAARRIADMALEKNSRK